MSAPPIRDVPPPCDARTPLCSLCGAETYFDGESRLVCDPCGAWWPSKDYWIHHGHWDAEGEPACGAKVMPWAGDEVHPLLAATTEVCVLTAGHEPPHRSAEEDWTDDDADGFITELLRTAKPLRPGDLPSPV